MLYLSATVVAWITATGLQNVTIPNEKYVIESNGLEVILSEDHSLPIVAVNIWYHAGPINEPPQRTGFAHLFEHLMFQGSKHIGDDLHFKYLDSSGASLINGTTDFDRTNYFETVPSNQLELALWLESDRMGFLQDALSQKKLDNQRDVVMNERRQSVENVPYGPSEEKLVQTLFPEGHPYYGNVIGSMADLNAATLNDVQDFYRQYYAPANATLVVAGDFDPNTVKTLIEKYFGTLPRRAAPTPSLTTTPPITSEKRVTIPEPVELARLSFGWLSPSAFKPGDAECDYLATIFGGGTSSRLYKKLVYELQLAHDVSAHQQSLALASTFTINVQARPGADIKKLEDETQKIIDEMRKTGPTAAEMNRARNIIVSGLVRQLQNIGGFGGRADTLNLFNQYLGDPNYLGKNLARYDAVTAQNVMEQAQNVLQTQKRATIITVPKS